MSEILSTLSLTWNNVFSRFSDMTAWCLVLMVIKPLYLPRRKNMLPIIFLLIISGSVIQLALDVLSSNNVVFYIILFILWSLVILTTCLRGRIEHKVLHAIMFGFAWLQTVQLSMVISSLLQQTGLIVHHRIFALILYFAYLTFSLKNAPNADRPLSKKYFYCLTIVSCTSAAICLSGPIVQAFHQRSAFLALYGGGTLLIEAIVLHLVNQLILQSEKDTTQILWHRQRVESSTLANKAAAFEEEYRHFRHEISHTASLVTNMIHNKEYDNAQNILASLQQSMETRRNTTSGNAIIDAILDTYRSKAETMRVLFSAEISLSETVAFSSLDLCSMLSNMLSNALEASVGCPNPFVHIDIYPVKRYLMIRVKNRVTNNVLDDNPNLITTKNTPTIHGNGTRIMKQICDKYQGMLNFAVTDLVFCAEAFLLLSESNPEEKL